jgi:hypothetical protein
MSQESNSINTPNLELTSDPQNENKESQETTVTQSQENKEAIKMLSKKIARSENTGIEEDKPIKKFAFESSIENNNSSSQIGIETSETTQIINILNSEDKTTPSEVNVEALDSNKDDKNTNNNNNKAKINSGLPKLIPLAAKNNNNIPSVTLEPITQPKSIIESSDGMAIDTPSQTTDQANNTGLESANAGDKSPSQGNTIYVSPVIVNQQPAEEIKDIPASAKQSSDNLPKESESNLPKVDNPPAAKKLSFAAAKKEIDDFAALLDNIAGEMKDKYGINIVDSSLDEFLPDEVKIKLIEEYFNDKELQKLAKEHTQ